MKRRQILLPAMTFAAAALGAACAYAEDAKPIVIETKADPRVPNGTLADLSGFTDDKGPLMKLEGLSIFQPVFVTIVSGDVATHLRVKISKPDGQDIIFEGATGEKGSVAAKFRSQGEDVAGRAKKILDHRLGRRHRAAQDSIRASAYSVRWR
jgi:hypothetical protein